MGQAKTLNFTSYIRPAIFRGATPQDGRLNQEIKISISDNYSHREITSSDLSISFIAAKDIAGLNPAAIKHMAPAPHTKNAETNKLVHIDFWDPGLPWRYTPEVSADDKQKPWMVLLVGTAEEIKVEKGIVTFVADNVLLEHDLKNSHLWAHVQSDGETTFSRIISPKGLKKNSSDTSGGLVPQENYIAVLVPAFSEKQMWEIENGKNVTRNFSILPAFHSWTFKTDEKGDFLTLAKALKPAEKNTYKIGKAKLYYKRQYYKNGKPLNPEINESMEIGGAITSIIENKPTDEQLSKVMQDVNGLKTHIPDAINLPDYGRPWLPNPDAVTIGWPAQINKDPRFRGITGIGTWMGIEAQEVLMDAAVKQAGALREAGQRIGYLALGLLASGRVWGKRMPTDENERLRTLGPMMSRMLAKDGGVILDRVTNDTSPLSKAVFSSAAQRVLKQAKGRLKYLNKNETGSYYSQFLNQANTISPESEEISKGLPHIENMGLSSFEDFFKIQYKELRDIWYVIVRLSKDFFSEFLNLDSSYFEKWKEEDYNVIKKKYFAYINDILIQNNSRCWESKEENNYPDFLVKISFKNVLEEDNYFNLLLTEFWYAIVLCKSNLERCWIACRKFNASNNSPITSVLKHRFPNRPDQPKIPENFCEDFIRQAFPPPIIPKKPINLGALSDIIFMALDPRQDNPPALRRICSRIKINGEGPVDCKKLVRPEYPIGLDFPTWTLLKDKDQEWFLPGVNNLEKDSVIALQTNPAFIDAYLLGLNSQFLSEMRWRDMAVDLNCTPLRMFWGQVNNKTQKREADIEPLTTWTDDLTVSLGDASHQTMYDYDSLKEGEKAGGNNLVLVFRTDLFRRYPNTLVYLVKPDSSDLDDVKKLLTEDLQFKDGNCSDPRFFKPVFIGSINPEITFFIFNVKPNELEKYWVLLDEPPTELRFQNSPSDNTDNSGEYIKSDPAYYNENSGQFADAFLDVPIRVAIEGKKLSPENESQL